jgi:aldehyde dehydrogenase (NAD+)
VQLGLPRRVLASMPELLLGLPAEEQIGATRVVREPVGVVGCITPWNYPLHQIVAKVAPALAAGCTTVLKPSEVTPLCAFHFARLVERAGLPPGVFNLVSGVGPVVGEALAAHPGVDMISFTGSTQAGRRVAALAAATVKRVALELGGKSANVILDDADFDAAVASGVERCFPNSGQTCSAWTRMLVPRARLEEANRIAKATAETFTVGDPETDVRLGPLVSARQRDRVRAHVRGALEQGATLLCGGPDAPEGLPRGFFFRPTVFTNVRPTMTIAQEEVFGPVLAILPYEDEDDAVELANGTIYGLAAAVWSRHPDRARRVASRLRAGQVYINGGAFNPIAPFGGFKQSGLGRELGRHGLEEFFELKALQYPEGT